MSKFQLLIFCPRPTAGTCSAHRVHPPTKLHKITKYPQPIWIGVPFMKKVQNLKFLLAGQPAWPFGPFFSGCGTKFQIPLPTFFLGSLFWFRKGMTRPPCFKPLGGDRICRFTIFRGPGLTLWASGSDLSTKKLFAKSLGDPENLAVFNCPLQKLQHFFAGRTETHFPTTPVPLGKIFWNFFAQTCKISTIYKVNLASLDSLPEG